MPTLVLCVGITEERGFTPPPVNRTPTRRTIDLSHEVGVEMVGTATFVISKVRSGRIQKVQNENLDTYSNCVAITRSADCEISCGVFLEVCWQGCLETLALEGFSPGVYTVAMVGIVAVSEAAYYRGEVEILNRGFRFRWKGDKGAHHLIPGYSWEIKVL